MTITILHGDNQVKSREKRHLTLTNYQAKDYEIRILEGESLLAKDLLTTLSTTNLFGNELIVIDNLLSRLKSKEKEACIKTLSDYKSDKEIILWEKRELTKTMLKPLESSAKIEVFKETSTLFPFIDALKCNNAKSVLTMFHIALKDNDVMLIFGMIVRRITDLIIAIDDDSQLKGSPWGIKQIIAQSKSWDLPRLLKFHESLLKIDLATKTGGTKLDLISQLDLLFMEL